MERYSSKRENYRWTSKEESDQLKITAKKTIFRNPCDFNNQGFWFLVTAQVKHIFFQGRQLRGIESKSMRSLQVFNSIAMMAWFRKTCCFISFHFIRKAIPKPNKWDKSNQNPGCRKFNSQSCLSCLHRVGMVSKREKGHSPLWHLKKSWNTPLACFEKLFGVAIEQCKYSFVRMFFSIQFSFSETHHITSPS